MSNKLAYEQTDVCALCNSTSIVFDSETSEAICSSCGMVVKDNIESMSPEWRSYAGDDIESKSRSIRALIVAAVYASCRDMSVPRTLEEISVVANTDAIFAGKCYRLLVRNLELRLPVIDSNKYLARISNKAKVSEKTCRSALDMLSTIKNDPISHGKDPNALAVAVLYAACVREGENVSQAQVAVAGDISIVTLRKRFQDVRKIFPS